VIRRLIAAWRVLSVSTFLIVWSLRMRLRRPRASDEAYEEWRREYLRRAAQGILDRLGVRVQAHGDFPRQAGLLVTNHLGYLDVMVLASLGPTVFVSRADVQQWPIVGKLTAWCQTIYIDRGRRDQIPAVIDSMRSALATGASVVFFPEGTSGPGDEVMPFRASLFGLAVEESIPVRAAVLGYRTDPADRPARDSVCWWGDASFAPHLLGLAALREVAASVHFIEHDFVATDRKELARDCHDAIASHFVPVTGNGGPV